METLSIQFIQADTASTAFRMAMLTTVLHKSIGIERIFRGSQLFQVLFLHIHTMTLG